jgi:hypothetical protein
MVTSSAVVGSSAIRRSGVSAGAIAACPAALASRELMRILLHSAGAGDPDELEHLRAVEGLLLREFLVLQVTSIN